MTKHCLLTLICLAAATIAAATDWKTTTDVIPGGRHYRELNGLASGYSENDGSLTWNFEADTKVIFALHMPNGHVRSDMIVQTNGRVVHFNVRITHPVSETVVIDHAVATEAKSGKQTIEILPDTELQNDGWYFVEFTSPDARQNLNQLYSLNFQRTSSKAVTAANSMMAPAVHLWWSTTDPNAPSGDSFDWIYMEALIPEVYKQSCTYQMTIGSNGLYSGIQTNHLLNDDSWTHAVIFSAWDAGDTDKDKSLPDYLRSGALDTGDEAYAVRFGGEGTGASLRYPEGQRWQSDHWVQMMMYERPDYIERESVDEAGNKVVKPFRSTLLSYWYKQAEDTEWHYFGTLRAAGTYRMEGNHSGLYSFLENWSGFGGDRYRRVYYRNGCMRSTASGKWFSLNHAGFGSTQHWETQRNSRDDYGHGVTSLYDNSFYIESGGLLGVRDSADTYDPVPQGQMPWVDTIDIQGLKNRVEKAVLRTSNKDINMRMEATAVVSDPATWKLTAFSDEEVEAEGEYGRAAQILDGNTSSYYRQKNYSSYPHVFTFDAGQEVTVRSVGLYQAFDLHYRAKQAQLFYSLDGVSFTSAGSLSFENDDAPTAYLSQPVTARYFRLRFTRGYGNNLAVNEVYFKNEYRMDDLKVLAADLIAQEDRFGGYRPEALAALKAVYDGGNVSDIDALVNAIRQLGENAQPLSFGNVDKANHITSFTAYQLHNPYGYGDLVADEAGQLSIAGSTRDDALEAYQRPTRVSSPADNWLILRSETYNEYYLYNLGAKKYLAVSSEGIAFSETPVALALGARTDGFTVGVGRVRLQLAPAQENFVVPTARLGEPCVFELRNNYAVSPADEEIRQLLQQSEEALHGQPDGIRSHPVDPSSPLVLRPTTDVHVVNLQGIEVYRGAYGALPSLPAGIYLLQSGNTVIKKVVR